LTAAFEALAHAPHPLPVCDHIRPGYRRWSVARHMVYFRLATHGMDVIGVLRERMDAQRRLRGCTRWICGLGLENFQCCVASPKRNTLRAMKNAFIPQIRVEAELRAELEAVLQQGETLSGFVETSVRNAVEFRRVQTRFHERGQSAWEDYERTGRFVPADEVLTTLQEKLDARRKQLRR
jgi:hypothetical protein